VAKPELIKELDIIPQDCFIRLLETWEVLDKVRSIGSGRKGGRASADATYNDGGGAYNGGDLIAKQAPMRVRSF
jgi:hypothetical protein